MERQKFTIPLNDSDRKSLMLSGYTMEWPEGLQFGYSFVNMIQMFGYRIQDAIRTDINGESGLDRITMEKKLKWWKFWNNDLKKACKQYTGRIFEKGEIFFNVSEHYRDIKDTHNKTVPPSENSPTLAPEHPKPRKRALTAKYKPKNEGKLVIDHVRTIDVENDHKPEDVKVTNYKHKNKKNENNRKKTRRN